MLGVSQLLPTLPPILAVRSCSHLNGTRTDILHSLTLKDNNEGFPCSPEQGPKTIQKGRQVQQTGGSFLITLYRRIVTLNWWKTIIVGSLLSTGFIFIVPIKHGSKLFRKKQRQNIGSCAYTQQTGAWVRRIKSSRLLWDTGEGLFWNQQMHLHRTCIEFALL